MTRPLRPRRTRGMSQRFLNDAGVAQVVTGPVVPASTGSAPSPGQDTDVVPRAVSNRSQESCKSVIQHVCYAAGMREERIFVTVQSRGLIAIPTAIRRHFGLDQPGAQVEVIEREGEIVLRPHVAVPADQAWFWSERWQQREREADDAVAAGRVAVVDGVEELLADLDA